MSQTNSNAVLDRTLVQVPKFVLQEIEVLGKQCADTGACHHQCETKCFRKESCSPLSVAAPWLNDDWSLKV